MWNTDIALVVDLNFKADDATDGRSFVCTLSRKCDLRNNQGDPIDRASDNDEDKDQRPPESRDSARVVRASTPNEDDETANDDDQREEEKDIAVGDGAEFPVGEVLAHTRGEAVEAQGDEHCAQRLVVVVDKRRERVDLLPMMICP